MSKANIMDGGSIFYVLGFEEKKGEDDIYRPSPYGLSFSIAGNRDKMVAFINETLKDFNIPFISIIYNPCIIEEDKAQKPSDIVKQIETYALENQYGYSKVKKR